MTRYATTKERDGKLYLIQYGSEGNFQGTGKLGYYLTADCGKHTNYYYGRKSIYESPYWYLISPEHLEKMGMNLRF